MNELAALRQRVAELEAAEAERKRAEQALRESEDRYRAVFDSTGAATIIVEEDTTISAANQEFERLSGYSREEVEGKKSWTEFIVPEDLARMKGYYESQRTDPASAPRSYEFRAVDRQGAIKDIFLTIAAIPATNRSVASLLDISARKQAEEALKNSHEELRRLAAQLQLVREEERATVAWELHDEVEQALAALQIDLYWLERRLPKDDAELLDKARSMSRLIQSNTERLRRLYMELRPGMLDDLGLGPTIEWQAGEFQKRTGIKAVLSLDGDAGLRGDGCSLAVYRVFQEALDNVARHADATEVNIGLRETDNGLVLEIADNGRGITKKQVSSPGSSGLVGMRERVHPWGGKVKISGVRGKGTTVRVSVPAGKEEL